MAKIAEEILSRLETNVLKAKLLEFPSMILDQKAAIRTLKDEYAEKEQERAMLEADLMTQLSAESDQNTGKAKFSNDKARQAELQKRKSTDPMYIEAALAARYAGHRLSEAQDELDAMADKFKAYRYVTKLTAEELALLASEEAEAVEDHAVFTSSHKQLY